MLQFDLAKAIAMIEERWGKTGTWVVGVVLLVAVLAFIAFGLNQTLTKALESIRR